MDQLRFGIMGTGNIARQFIEGIRGGATRSTVTAVASRSLDKAQAFADAYGIDQAHGSYQALVVDPEVDAIYNALPNAYHKQWTLAALESGKHVLCEKPMGMDASEVKAMFDAAKRADRLLVEAFMYRCHPQTQAVIQAVRDGAIGELRTVRTTFAYRTQRIDGNTRFDQSLGGGAVMDIGCYCVDFTNQLFNAQPQSIHAIGRLHDATDGGAIDVSASGVLGYPGGGSATFTCAMDTQASNLAEICGTEGYITVPVPWKPGVEPNTSSWTIRRMARPRQDGVTDDAGQQTQTIDSEADQPLYALEADAFARAVLDREPAFMSAEDSIGLATVLDELRRQVGVTWS